MTKLSLFATSNQKIKTFSTALMVSALGIVLVAAFFFRLWPVFNQALPSEGDGILIAYLIDWVGQSLLHHHNFWQVPFFHPLPLTLAFSDPYLSTGLSTLLLQQLQLSLPATNNLLLVGHTIAMWLLVVTFFWRHEKKALAALIGATLFCYSAWHWHYTVHLHTYVLTGLVLSVWSLTEWYESGRSHWFAIACFGLVGQAMHSPQTGLFTLGIWLVLFFQKKWCLKLKFNFRSTTPWLLISFGIIGLTYGPFFSISHMYHYTRSIRDTAHFSAGLERFISFDIAGVLLFSLFTWWKNRFGKNRSHQAVSFQGNLVSMRTIFTITGLGLLLMLGPVVKVSGQTFHFFSYPIPLPYAILYYVVPGFQAFRSSSRWIVVAGFGLSWLATRVIATTNYSKKILWPMFFFTTLFLWCTNARTWQLYTLPTSLPQEYTILESQPFGAVAEFPIYIWSMHPYVIEETNRLIYQRIHQRPLYNGASGFTPPDRLADWEKIWATGFSNETIDLLEKNDITYLLIHFDQYQKMHQDNFIYGTTPTPSITELQFQISAQHRLQLLACQEQACLYTIRK